MLTGIDSATQSSLEMPRGYSGACVTEELPRLRGRENPRPYAWAEANRLPSVHAVRIAVRSQYHYCEFPSMSSVETAVKYPKSPPEP